MKMQFGLNQQYHLDGLAVVMDLLRARNRRQPNKRRI